MDKTHNRVAVGVIVPSVMVPVVALVVVLVVGLLVLVYIVNKLKKPGHTDEIDIGAEVCGNDLNSSYIGLGRCYWLWGHTNYYRIVHEIFDHTQITFNHSHFLHCRSCSFHL